MKRAVWTLGLLLLAGCVAAPERREVDTDIHPPDAWTADPAPTPGAQDSAWWESFGDPDLDELIELALERNLDLHAAVARLDRAVAQAKIAGADLKPSVGIGLDAGRRRQNFIGFPFGPGGEIPSTTFTSYGLSLGVSWEIDLWGRIRATARSAVAEMQATEADLYAARLSIAAQTAKIWFSILELRQQVTLADDSVTSFRLSANQVRSRFEAGTRPPLDLRLALSNLAGAAALLDLRRTQLDIAERQLEVLLGRYPDRSIVRALEPGKLPDTPPPIPAGLPSELLTRRPDLVASERRLAAADQRYLAARRSLYPRLTLTASGGTMTETLGDLVSGDFRVWSILGGLTQPLFEGGRLKAGVEQADAISRERLVGHVAGVLGAFAEVESSLAAEAYLAGRERHLGEAARQLIAARRLAEERYRRGVGTYLIVLESQTRAVTAESSWLDVRRLRLDNRVNLHLALGGGFELPADFDPGAGDGGSS